MRARLLVAGDTASFNAAEFASRLAQLVNVPQRDVHIEITPASVLLDATIAMPSAMHAQAAATTLRIASSSMELSTELGATVERVLDVRATSRVVLSRAPAVAISPLTPPAPAPILPDMLEGVSEAISAADEDSDEIASDGESGVATTIIGIVVGGVGVLLLCVMATFCAVVSLTARKVSFKDVRKLRSVEVLPGMRAPTTPVGSTSRTPTSSPSQTPTSVASTATPSQVFSRGGEPLSVTMPRAMPRALPPALQAEPVSPVVAREAVDKQAEGAAVNAAEESASAAAKAATSERLLNELLDADYDALRQRATTLQQKVAQLESTVAACASPATSESPPVQATRAPLAATPTPPARATREPHPLDFIIDVEICEDGGDPDIAEEAVSQEAGSSGADADRCDG